MQFILRETAPQIIEINGIKYPAIWNFRAIALMEEYTGISHLYSIARIKSEVITSKDIVGFFAGMMISAGVEYPAREEDENLVKGNALAKALEKSLKPEDQKLYVNQILKIISVQGDQPAEGESKNGEPVTNSTGTK